MTWTFTSKVEVYAGAAEPWLLRDPVRNTVPLTVLRGMRGGIWGDDLLMGWLERGGRPSRRSVRRRLTSCCSPTFPSTPCGASPPS
ncbi:hypothetical protein ACFQX6_58170 [Streptosporangium lutulentum]